MAADHTIPQLSKQGTENREQWRSPLTQGVVAAGAAPQIQSELSQHARSTQAAAASASSSGGAHARGQAHAASQAAARTHAQAAEAGQLVALSQAEVSSLSCALQSLAGTLSAAHAAGKQDRAALDAAALAAAEAAAVLNAANGQLHAWHAHVQGLQEHMEHLTALLSEHEQARQAEEDAVPLANMQVSFACMCAL